MKDDRVQGPRIETAPPVRYSVPPRISSQIVIKTLPGAICTLHIEHDDDPARGLKVYADQEGMVRLHVRPSAASDSLVKVVVDSEEGGMVRISTRVARQFETYAGYAFST